MTAFEISVVILLGFQAAVLIAILFTLETLKYWLKNIDAWCEILSENDHHYAMRKEAMLKGIGQAVGARNSDSRGYFT